MPEQSGVQIGTVVAVSGEVTAEAAGGGRILAVDGPIYQDDVLITEQGERLEVLFNDGTRLAQGESSRLQIDTYVFDSAAPEASAMLLKAAEGTFRTITGKIAAENPENFTIKTPLATLGIRGTTVLSHITPDHEMHGPEFIDEGKAFVLIDNFGNIRFITDYVPVKVIDVWPDEPAGFQRILTEGEFLFFEEQAPLTTPEGEESSEAESGALLAAAADQGTEAESGSILAAAAAKGAEALFGPDSPDAPAWGDSVGVPQLFGPEGLPPLKPLPLELAPPAMEPPPVTDQARDLLNGVIEDTSHRNSPPLARDIFGVTDEDQALFGVLDGSDPDGDPLSYAVTANPAHGTVIVNADGSYSYQPDANYFGPDSFAYQVTDPYGETSSALVTIQVDPVNDDPVARDAAFTTEEGDPVSGQLFGYDVDGDPLNFSVRTGPGNGTITITPDGRFTYDPNDGFIGTDTFQFLLSDGQGGYDIGQVTIEVEAGPAPPPTNGPPTQNPSTLEVTQGDVQGDGNLADSDPDGDPLTYTLVSGPAFGALTLNNDGTFTYSSIPGINSADYGPVTFEYQVTDGTNTVTFTETIMVNPYLQGGTGVNILNGTPYNDVIEGLEGNDELTGNAGSDTFVFSVNDGYDDITDFETGADILQISGTLPGTSIIALSGPGYGGTITAASGAAVILYENTNVGTWQVIYDPDVSAWTTYPSPSESYLANLGSHPIDSGDVVLS